MSKNKKVDPNCLEIGVHPAPWVVNNDVLEDCEIRDIFEFYTWYGPYCGVSSKEVPFAQYGWKDNNPKKDGYLIKRIFETANLKDDVNFFVANKNNETKRLFEKAEMNCDFWNKYCENRIAILVSQNLLVCIFKAIRNSFAHARFIVMGEGEDRYFVFENGIPSKNNFETKARMVLKVSTLKQWKNIVQNEAKEEERIKRELEEQIERAILYLIDSRPIKSEEVLYSLLDFDRKDSYEVLKKLKKHLISYNRSKRCWERI